MERNSSFHIRKLSTMSPNKTKSHSLHRKGGKLRPKHHCATPTPSSPDKQRGKASLQSIVYAKPSYVDQLSIYVMI